MGVLCRWTSTNQQVTLLLSPWPSSSPLKQYVVAPRSPCSSSASRSPPPITGQSSSGPQGLQERPDGPPPDIENEVVLESIQNGSPDLIQSSSHMTSLPVVNDQPIGELTGESLNISEDLPAPEEEPAVDVSVRSILINTSLSGHSPFMI